MIYKYGAIQKNTLTRLYADLDYRIEDQIDYKTSEVFNDWFSTSYNQKHVEDLFSEFDYYYSFRNMRNKRAKKVSIFSDNVQCLVSRGQPRFSKAHASIVDWS